MTNPLIPGITAAEQDVLYQKLNEYNLKKASFKEVGAYLVVLPRADCPRYSLWIYSPLPEILRIDPGYLTWIAFKFTPRIPKQERFAQIARIYHSVYIDILQRKAKQPPAGRFLGKEGEKVTDLTLTVLSVRLEDAPYKTQVRGTTPYFYVRQILRLKDTSGNLVTFRVNSRTASRHSCQLPAVEHAYRTDETVHIASARIAGTYTIGKNKWTRLNYVKFHP